MARYNRANGSPRINQPLRGSTVQQHRELAWIKRTLHRPLAIVRGQAAERVANAERLSDVERRLARLEKAQRFG